MTEIYIPPQDRPLCGVTRTQTPEKYIRPHGTPLWLLLLTSRGSATFYFPKAQPYSTQAGDFLLIRSGVRQEFQKRSKESWVCSWVHFLPRTEWITLLNWKEIDSGYFLFNPTSSRSDKKVSLTFHMLMKKSREKSAYTNQWLLHHLEHFFLESFESRVNPASKIDPRIKKIVEWIDLHFRHPLSLQTIADQGNLSIPHCLRLFRKEVGLTPRLYWENLRIEDSKKLLLFSSKSIDQIAREVGFENGFYFSLRFKKIVKVNPSDFRRLQGGGPAYQKQIHKKR